MITNHRTSSFRRILSTIACGILLTAFTGCGNDRSTPLDDNLPSVGDLVEIKILTNGIESFADAEEVATRSALAGGTEGEQNEQTVHTQVQPLEDGRLLVATVKASKATRGAAASSTSTRAIPLTNTTLRVLAYDSDGKYVDECMYDVNGSSVATAKKGQSLVVPARVTPYTFYCYSPGLCYSNTETKEVSVGATDFFAFGTQKAVINGGNSGAQVVVFPTLALKVAMIKLAVTSDGDAAAAVSCTATLTGGKFANSGATFSLTSGTYSSGSGTSVQSKSFGANSTEIIVPPSNTGEMTLTLSDLVVGGTTLSSPPISILAIELAAGTKYTLDIKVKTVLPKAPFVILPSIGLRVAKGNLMRVGDTGYWYLAPDQGYYTGVVDGDDYHSWDVSTLNAGCVAVLGVGWRVPSKTENEDLAGMPKIRGSYRSQRGPSNGYYFGTTNKPDVAHQDECAFLPAAGFRNSSGSVSNGDSRGYYWCNEPKGEYSAYYLFFDNSYVNGADSGINRPIGLSVRCVAEYD